MANRKHIKLKKSTYEELKTRRTFETEALTSVLNRLIDKYGGLVK